MSLLFRWSFIVVVIVCCFNKTNAQKKKDDISFPSFSIRTNPLSFLEADGNVMLGIGARFNPRWGAMIDAGYLFWRPFAERGNEEDAPLSGFKIRADIRYFLNNYRRKVNLFVGPEFHYKYADYGRWEDFGFNCIGGQCGYYQRAKYKLEKREIGGSVKAGMTFHITHDHWRGEVYAGIGVKFKKYKQSNIPTGASFVNTPEYDDIPIIADTGATDSDALAHLLVPLGFKFVYVLW